MCIRVNRFRHLGNIVRRLVDFLVADLVDGADEAVKEGFGRVGRGPEGFAVVRVATATEVLFLALVDDGDAVGEEGEGDDGFGEGEVGV